MNWVKILSDRGKTERESEATGRWLRERNKDRKWGSMGGGGRWSDGWRERTVREKKSSVNKCWAVRPGDNLITACHHTTYFTQQRPPLPVTRPFISITCSPSFPLALLPSSLFLLCFLSLAVHISYSSPLPLLTPAFHKPVFNFPFGMATELMCNDSWVRLKRVFGSEVNHRCSFHSGKGSQLACQIIRRW